MIMKKSDVAEWIKYRLPCAPFKSLHTATRFREKPFIFTRTVSPIRNCRIPLPDITKRHLLRSALRGGDEGTRTRDLTDVNRAL